MENTKYIFGIIRPNNMPNHISAAGVVITYTSQIFMMKVQPNESYFGCISNKQNKLITLRTSN